MRMHRTSALHLALTLGAISMVGCATAIPSVPPATRPLTPGEAAVARTPVIVTTDPDGAPRATRLWTIALDGAVYIRTGESRWFWNIQRDPEVILQIGGASHALRAEPVDDEALRQRLHQAFRAKYAWWDRIIHPCGAPDANLMRLVPRAATPPSGS